MSKVKNLAISISKKNVFLRKIIRGMHNFLKRIQYKIVTIGTKTDNRTIIFACFNGKSYSCSPKAIYKYMVNHKKYENYKYIWAFRNPEEYKRLENNKDTVVVNIDSKQYKKYLAKAKYWIFNYKIPDYIYPKKNQVFIQCWHGTPLKRLGCDLEHFDNVLNTMKGIKKRYKIEASKFSYFISPSKFASEKFISAWNLKEIGKENIIVEEGYPRNDFLLNYTKQDEENIKKKLGIENDNRKIILYAPTYRSDQHQTGVGYTYKEELNFAKLQEEIGNKYIILFRPHYFIANIFDFEKYKGFVYNVSDIDDINELYIISDILITDYSSVFFDYANLKRPMIFFMYDLEHYKNESNGFYIDLNELPGPIVETQEDLEKSIEDVDFNIGSSKKYKEFNEKYNYLDDGNASKRVIEKVILEMEKVEK